MRTLFVQVQELSFIIRLEDFMDCLHWACRNACSAIDTHIGVNIAALTVGMKTLDRAVFDAICKKTEPAIVRYDMWHILQHPRMLNSRM